MQRSNILSIVSTLAVFVVTAGLFFALGRGLLGEERRVSEPLVVIPLDSEAEVLRAELHQVTIDREQLQSRLTAAIEQLALSQEELRETTRQVADLSTSNNTAQDFYAAELARSSALKGELAAMARQAEERELEIEIRGATIAALEKALDESLTAEEAAIETAAVVSRAVDPSEEESLSEPPNGLAAKLSTAEPASPQAALTPVVDDLEVGLLAYKDHDYEAAYQTWQPLAEQGVRRAQFYLGGLYLDGRGVAADKIQAIYWLTLASDAGYQPSGELLSEVTALLDETELAAAQKLLDARKGETP